MRTSLPSVERGVKYNFLTLTGTFEVRPKSHIYVECECQCGLVVFKRLSEVYKGTTKSCGSKTCKELSQKVEIAKGDRYGRLVLTGNDEMRIGEGSQLKRYVEADCDCGVRKFVLLSSLRNSSTQSCGCYHKDRILETNVTHGGTVGRNFHPTYFTWCGMKQRCYNPSCDAYVNYGERGISMCEEWRNDYVSFYEWSLTNNWQKGLSLDRIDNDSNYEPSNCRWTTRKVQNRNRRSNVFVSAFGETKCLTDWGADERCKVDKSTLFTRIMMYGMSAEEAMSAPNKPYKDRHPNQKTLTAFGQTKFIADWLLDERCTVTRGGLVKRLNNGWDVEKAMTAPRVTFKFTDFKDFSSHQTTRQNAQ